MNTIYENTMDCTLMVWEANPRKRNTNNTIKIAANKKVAVKPGDILIGSYSEKRISCYEILKIIDRRKSNLRQKEYLTLTTKWTAKKPKFKDFKIATSETFKELFNI